MSYLPAIMIVSRRRKQMATPIEETVEKNDPIATWLQSVAGVSVEDYVKAVKSSW
jgi:hypothetical protein